MSLPTGRDAQRVRSCGRARKRDETGRLLGGEEAMRGARASSLCSSAKIADDAVLSW
jgi:hypothetical protein